MSRIFWDTNLFIYMLEGGGELMHRTQEVLVRMTARRDELITSALTVGEVLVKPLEKGQRDMAIRYEHFFSSPGVRIVDFDRVAAGLYAGVRTDRSIRPPDAIQLSCAAAAGTNLFITNDERLSKKNVRGVDFILPLSQVFL
jgi:predicted nucleic acid-binding protein